MNLNNFDCPELTIRRQKNDYQTYTVMAFVVFGTREKKKKHTLGPRQMYLARVVGLEGSFSLYIISTGSLFRFFARYFLRRAIFGCANTAIVERTRPHADFRTEGGLFSYSLAVYYTTAYIHYLSPLFFHSSIHFFTLYLNSLSLFLYPETYQLNPFPFPFPIAQRQFCLDFCIRLHLRLSQQTHAGFKYLSDSFFYKFFLTA